MDAVELGVNMQKAIYSRRNLTNILSTVCAECESELRLYSRFCKCYPHLCGKPTTWRFVNKRATIGARIEGVEL